MNHSKITQYFVTAWYLYLLDYDLAVKAYIRTAVREYEVGKDSIADARTALVHAEHRYLEATGWKYVGADTWLEPARQPWPCGRRELFHGHAVNSQKYWERNVLKRQPENPRSILHWNRESGDTT